MDSIRCERNCSVFLFGCVGTKKRRRRKQKQPTGNTRETVDDRNNPICKLGYDEGGIE